jgi:hypothetical protein
MTKAMSRRVIRNRILLSMLAGLVFGVVISEMTFYFLNTGETRPPESVELVIPAGTADRVARGESDPTLPSTMVFVAGDTLVVKNLDSVVHELGPLVIPSGTSASMKLDSEQNYAFTCSFEPSKYIGLNVYAIFALPLKKQPAA